MGQLLPAFHPRYKRSGPHISSGSWDDQPVCVHSVVPNTHLPNATCQWLPVARRVKIRLYLHFAVNPEEAKKQDLMYLEMKSTRDDAQLLSEYADDFDDEYIKFLGMLGCEEIRRRTRATDIAKRISSLKWQWAGHIARRADGRWGRKVVEWRPRIGKRSVGRPPRWTDDLVKAAGSAGCRPLPTEATGACLRSLEYDNEDSSRLEDEDVDTAMVLHEENKQTLEDQSGKAVELPPSERRALMVGLALHERGRAAARDKDYPLALVLLLEADRQLSECRSSILSTVDNVAVLQLDVAWCYLCLQAWSALADAAARLARAERALAASYGQDRTRVLQLKGTDGECWPAAWGALADAAARLARAERALAASYGQDRTRVLQLKGTDGECWPAAWGALADAAIKFTAAAAIKSISLTIYSLKYSKGMYKTEFRNGKLFIEKIPARNTRANERALLLRLYLLQGIVCFHQNKREEARHLLDKAEAELNSLRVSFRVPHVSVLGPPPCSPSRSLPATLVIAHLCDACVYIVVNNFERRAPDYCGSWDNMDIS
ncbi:hypothetical protein MSG28_009067 [Choristoneura fumiferana]|uniref:Uncharacterized protein n=1 Tax=Choristoneura fumiferana TaxID=7141 RepID=A0ACC0KWQ2_CHOFU|nr:hypothetical protein MSG28_009067 [Choristoneura fumiferana]